MFIGNLIEPPLWDRAIWRGVGYIMESNNPPILGLYFENEEAGAEIFKQWKSLIGDSDDRNLLRITIVEGPIVGAQPGYNVRIGGNAERVMEQLREAGKPSDETGYTISRIHRMNPPPGSPNLKRFKDALAQQGRYVLAQIAPTNTGLKVNPYSRIRKADIYFRQVEDIQEGDIDSDAVVAPPE